MRDYSVRVGVYLPEGYHCVEIDGKETTRLPHLLEGGWLCVHVVQQWGMSLDVVGDRYARGTNIGMGLHDCPYVRC